MDDTNSISLPLLQYLAKSTLGKPRTLIILVSILTIIGTIVVLSGGVWDASSHALKEPELFWTIQHISVYTGVSMIASAAIIAAILFGKHLAPYNISPALRLVIVSSAILIISGFGDSMSHEIFGIDGLLSWSHQPLELGLILASISGFLIVKNSSVSKLKFLEPMSIISILLSASWLGFNLILLVGATIQCIAVYEIFSSGCAIL